MSWWLPLQGSTFAPQIDGLFLAILIITGLAFVIVETGLIWFVFKYRGRPGRKGHYTHGNAKAEVVWTAIPAVTVVALGLVSNHYWKEIKGRDSIPADAYPIAIHAKQFEWQVAYPGPDGHVGTAGGFNGRHQPHVPGGRDIRVRLATGGLNPSFRVPAL